MRHIDERNQHRVVEDSRSLIEGDAMPGDVGSSLIEIPLEAVVANVGHLVVF